MGGSPQIRAENIGPAAPNHNLRTFGVCRRWSENSFVVAADKEFEVTPEKRGTP